MNTEILEKSVNNVKPTTIEDVAHIVGVSKMTVSRVLNGKRPNSAYQQSILETARQLGFKPNPHASSLSSNRCLNVVALFSLNLDQSALPYKLQFLQSILSEHGYIAPIHGYRWNEGDDATRQIDVLNDLRRYRPRAIICHIDRLYDEALKELTAFQDEGGLLICFDNLVDVAGVSCDHVLFDRAEAAYVGAKHLIELGHRDIGFFNGSNHFFVPDEVRRAAHHPNNSRESGLRRALEEHDLPLRPEWLLNGQQYSEGGADLAKRFLAMPRRPTAMCIVNDLAATAFVNEVLRAGLRVPEDVSIVSHDDTPVARYSIVPLTAVSHPVEAIAKNLADLLLSRLDGAYSGPPRRFVVHGELNVRQSSGPAQQF